MADNNSKTISEINELLFNKQYDKISAVFTDEFMQQIDSDELAYISLYVLIYREEIKNGIQNTSFTLGNNMQELIGIFRRLKFLLWEFEFDNNDESTKMLVDFIISKSISAEFLKIVVQTSSVNKQQVLTDLSCIFS